MPNVDLGLVICNEGEDREKVVIALLKCGLSPICCSNLREARTLLPQNRFRLVVCKENLTDGDFHAVLREVKKSGLQTPIIVLGNSTDWDSYLKALAAGAFEYIVSPPNPAEAQRIIWSALADTIDSEQASHAAD
jgi:two-component system, NtrC family, response regulator PilR